MKRKYNGHCQWIRGEVWKEAVVRMGMGNQVGKKWWDRILGETTGIRGHLWGEKKKIKKNV